MVKNNFMSIQGLETTATFDKATDEFVIHSPTITSTKYWPGDSGLLSDHACVFAIMIIDGKKYGVQPFIVQTRDRDSHLTLKGITCGDIGPKFGYHSKENGFLRFDNVRIPRENLLMRFISVDRDGTFSVNGDLRVLYSTMMHIRVQIVAGAPAYLSSGLTIATRYACVRRQFKTQEGTKLERKLMDYQSHMFKLTPLLAYTYVFSFSAISVMDMHQKLL